MLSVKVHECVRDNNMNFNMYLLLLCVICNHGIYGVIFVDEVPFTKVHPGDSASITWDLVEPMSLGLMPHLEIPGVVGCDSFQPLQCDTESVKYDLNVIPPEASLNSSIQATAIVFVLKDVDISDARTYEIRVTHEIQTSSATAVLYVFQKPTTPVLTLSPSSQSEGNTTIICSADSRSLPEENRYAVVMEYHWSVDRRPYVAQNGDPVNGAKAITARSRATVSCLAQEQGSRFVSDSVVFSYDAAISAVNSPAIVLGVVLLILAIIVCFVCGYMWCSGMIHMKMSLSETRYNVNDPAISGDGAATARNTEDGGEVTIGQYDQLGPRDTPQGYDETYEPIDSRAGGQEFAESHLYANV